MRSVCSLSICYQVDRLGTRIVIDGHDYGRVIMKRSTRLPNPTVIINETKSIAPEELTSYKQFHWNKVKSVELNEDPLGYIIQRTLSRIANIYDPGLETCSPSIFIQYWYILRTY